MALITLVIASLCCLFMVGILAAVIVLLVSNKPQNGD